MESLTWQWKIEDWKLKMKLEKFIAIEKGFGAFKRSGRFIQEKKTVSETVLFSKSYMLPMQNWVTVICQPKWAQFNNFSFSDNIE